MTRSYEDVQAARAVNDKAERDIRTRMDAHSVLTEKHRAEGRALGEKDDALRKELRENLAEHRALQDELEAVRQADRQLAEPSARSQALAARPPHVNSNWPSMIRLNQE